MNASEKARRTLRRRPIADHLQKPPIRAAFSFLSEASRRPTSPVLQPMLATTLPYACSVCRLAHPWTARQVGRSSPHSLESGLIVSCRSPVLRYGRAARYSNPSIDDTFSMPMNVCSVLVVGPGCNRGRGWISFYFLRMRERSRCQNDRRKLPLPRRVRGRAVLIIPALRNGMVFGTQRTTFAQLI